MQITPLKLFVAAGLIVIGAMSWQKQREAARSHLRLASTGDSGIVMLSASWCGYCDKLRDELERANVPFTELDVEDSAEGEDRFNALDADGVPVTIIGQEVVHGYDAERLSRLISASGYPIQLQ